MNSLSPDFAGGTERTAFVDGSDSRDKIVDPVPPHDPFVDLLRDHCRSGGDAWGFVRDFFSHELHERDCELIRRIRSMFAGRSNSRLVWDQMFWISGASNYYESETLGKLARRHGCSKQAFKQGADNLRESLSPIKSQSARTEDAKGRMSRRNSRRKTDKERSEQ